MAEINSSQKVSIGIDAGVVAAHQVAVRGAGVTEDFRVPPTLAGMARWWNGYAPTPGRWWWPSRPRGRGCR